MRAITLHRPWPFAIFSLGKDIENRRWAPQIGVKEKLVIHAGKKWDSRGAEWIRGKLGHWLPCEEEHPKGIVGVVQYDGIVKSSSSKWFVGPVGWRLTKQRRLSMPLPCGGKQGIWEVPSSFEQEIVKPPLKREASDELLGLCGKMCGEVGGDVGLALWFETESLYRNGDATDLWEHYQRLCQGQKRLYPLYTYDLSRCSQTSPRVLAKQYNAVVLDIRDKAATGSDWHCAALRRLLPRYHHVKSLGNKNERGVIELNDSARGIAFVCEMLRWQPVILLCVCGNIEGCHLRVVADMVSSRAGCVAIDLDLDTRRRPNQSNLERSPNGPGYLAQ